MFFSRHDGTDLDEVIEQIEEVILISHGLQEVSRSLRDLVHYVQSKQYPTVSLSDKQAAAVKACVICGGVEYALTPFP